MGTSQLTGTLLVPQSSFSGVLLCLIEASYIFIKILIKRLAIVAVMPCLNSFDPYLPRLNSCDWFFGISSSTINYHLLTKCLLLLQLRFIAGVFNQIL